MITKAQFFEQCTELAAMTPVAAEQTYQRWLVTGRIKQVVHPETGAITIDPIYISREARRTRYNAALLDGTIRGQ
jgi:hypothetical protein